MNTKDLKIKKNKLNKTVKQINMLSLIFRVSAVLIKFLAYNAISIPNSKFTNMGIIDSTPMARTFEALINTFPGLNKSVYCNVEYNHKNGKTKSAKRIQSFTIFFKVFI